MKHILFTMTLLFLINPSLYAQGKGGIARAAASKRFVPSAVSRGTLSHYGGVLGAGMGVDFHLTTRTEVLPRVATDKPKTPSIHQNRSWLKQQARDFKAYQLKQTRLKQEKLRVKAEQELERAKQALPALLVEKSFSTPDLNAFIPQHNQQPKPTVPFVAQPGSVAYRGLALSADGDAIRNIMINGLRLQDAGEENSTLRMAYASHGGYYAIRHLLENPVTNVTYGPNSAAAWGAKRLEPNLPILTLVKVRGNFMGDSMETVTEDIPASQIEEVAVRINLEGNLTWCKVQLNANNSFTLIPYAPHYK